MFFQFSFRVGNWGGGGGALSLSISLSCIQLQWTLMTRKLNSSDQHTLVLIINKTNFKRILHFKKTCRMTKPENTYEYRTTLPDNASNSAQDPCKTLFGSLLGNSTFPLSIVSGIKKPTSSKNFLQLLTPGN